MGFQGEKEGRREDWLQREQRAVGPGPHDLSHMGSDTYLDPSLLRQSLMSHLKTGMWAEHGRTEQSLTTRTSSWEQTGTQQCWHFCFGKAGAISMSASLEAEGHHLGVV